MVFQLLIINITVLAFHHWLLINHWWLTYQLLTLIMMNQYINTFICFNHFHLIKKSTEWLDLRSGFVLFYIKSQNKKKVELFFSIISIDHRPFVYPIVQFSVIIIKVQLKVKNWADRSIIEKSGRDYHSQSSILTVQLEK